jgi:hypothetical protein
MYLAENILNFGEELIDGGPDSNILDIPIFRTFSYLRAVELFKNKANTLVHPSLWDDPYENAFLRNGATDGTDFIDLADVHRDWYGQCWTTDGESDALWRIYSPDKQGVRLSTTIRKLFLSTVVTLNRATDINKYFLGKVSYYEKSKILSMMSNITFLDISRGGQGRSIAETFLIKRNAFRHEQEVRLLFNDFDRDRGRNKIVQFPLDPNKTFDDVLLDPRLPIALFNPLKAGLKNAGCTISIKQSDLYDPPKIRIKLS